MKKKSILFLFLSGFFLYGCSEKLEPITLEQTTESVAVLETEESEIMSSETEPEKTTDETGLSLESAESEESMETAEATGTSETAEMDTIETIETLAEVANYREVLDNFYWKDDADAEKEDGIFLRSAFQSGISCGDGYFYLNQVCEGIDNYLVLSYEIRDEKVEDSDRYMDGEDVPWGDAWSDNTGVRRKIALFDLSADKIIKEYEFPEGTPSLSVKIEGDQIWTWTYNENELLGTRFDQNLNIMDTDLQEYMLTNNMSQDHKSWYVVENGDVIKYASDGQPSQNMTEAIPFLGRYMTGLFYGADGHDLALVSGMASDLTDRTAMIDLNLSQVCFYLPESWSCYMYSNAVMISNSYTEEKHIFAVYRKDGRLLWCDDTKNQSFSIQFLSDDRFIIYYTDYDQEDPEFYFELYDANTLELITREHTKIKGISYYCNDGPILIGNRMIFEFYDHQMGSHYFYEWDMSKCHTKEKVFSWEIRDIPVEWKDSMQSIADPKGFIPKPCPEECLSCREKADQLEEKYGIEIKISKECSALLGGYAVSDLSDPNLVNQTLDIADQELSKYPDGFLKQIRTEYSDHLTLYFASNLISIGAGTISSAGGFETSDSDGIAVVMDCSYPEQIRTTIHHELFHAIEEVITERTDDLSDDNWNRLNPDPQGHDSCYTMSYQQFGYPEFLMYCYFYSPDQAYFIDEYAMTYPGEDRARIFEYAMSADWYIDWTGQTHLIAKLNWMAKSIRDSFDSSTWQNVLWERFMDHPEGN